ncbi:MAG: prolyl oligopeptidase family serine peptidase [Saprospiraceae bacterium]|nr:prolyl oligopeptidase family serine peptidase [Saprospiraceae bacterium]
MKTILLAVLFTFTALMVEAQLDLKYQMPDDDILSLADAPMPPGIRMNSNGDKAILVYRKSYKSIDELSEEELRLAGLRINPKTNISSRARYYYDIKYYDVKTKKESSIEGIPEGAKITNISWSPDENKIAFTNTVKEGVELWYIDYAAKKAHKLMGPKLNANMGSVCRWMKNSNEMLVKMLPESRPSLVNTALSVPSGPTVSINEAGQKAQNRTYQDLLKNPADEQNFEVLAHSELHMVTLEGESKVWKESGMYSSISVSPDGSQIMIQEISRPFSYLVTYGRFPTSYDIYGMDGQLIKNMVKVPLIEEMPKGFMSTRTGMRGLQWRADRPATLVWAEALDGGDPAIEVEFRDALYELESPFDGEKRLLVKSKLRYNGIEWGNDNLAVLYDYWWNDRTLRISFFDPSDASKEPVLFSERNYQDRYSDPGNFVSSKNKYDRYTLDIVNDDQLYLIGAGYSKEGKLPFVDRYDISENKTKRLYRAKSGEKLESISRMIDSKKGIILTRLESKSDYPNFYFRNINTGDLRPATEFENPFKAIQDVHKEVIKYKREDGLELSATLYLPVGYDKTKKEKMPMIMWAYPREFKDKSSASQVTSSSNEFTYPYYGSPIYWVNRGYVVLDDAAFPIIGEGDDQPNDEFISQLVGNAKAGIDAVDALGYIDRNKVAVGGHSYGAFMTANLLTHSNLFAAGIARSGAYNRTLTPFGFQSEERNYWEAPDVYYNMSPFMHCDKMKTPLLLIHGEADNNSGTYPMQSERYFNALKGLGAPVRLVMLPKESHGYAARESIMHMLWEQDQWLEKHVKNRVMTP